MNLSSWSQRFSQLTESIAEPNTRLIMATVLGTFGLWLLMPGRRRLIARILGGILGGLAVVCLLSLVPAVTFSLGSALFTILGSLTVLAAVGTVCSRSPIYCAVWFAVTLLGVGGLFLVNGAQFLGIATVAVYAGAIVVTLLFVLMLAQPEGHTRYDRISWGRAAQFLGCFAGACSACVLIWALLSTPADNVAHTAIDNPLLGNHHVANFGGRLFSVHLVEVEIAGVLLFAALVGAVAIAGATSRDGTGVRRQVQQSLSAQDGLGPGDIRHE